MESKESPNGVGAIGRKLGPFGLRLAITLPGLIVALNARDALVLAESPERVFPILYAVAALSTLALTTRRAERLFKGFLTDHATLASAVIFFACALTTFLTETGRLPFETAAYSTVFILILFVDRIINFEFWSKQIMQTDLREAKRQVPLLYATGSVARLVAGLLVVLSGELLRGQLWLTFAFSGSMLLAASWVELPAGGRARVEEASASAPTEETNASDLGPYLTAVSLVVFASGAFGQLVTFGYKVMIGQSAGLVGGTDSAGDWCSSFGILEILGAVVVASSLLQLLIQLTVYGSLVNRLGVGRSSYLVPSVLVFPLGFVFAGLSPCILIVAKTLEKTLQKSLSGPLARFLIAPIDSSQLGRATRRLDKTIPAWATVSVAAFCLLYGWSVIGPAHLYAGLWAVLAFWLVSTAVLQGRYRAYLLRQLQRGRISPLAPVEVAPDRTFARAILSVLKTGPAHATDGAIKLLRLRAAPVTDAEIFRVVPELDAPHRARLVEILSSDFVRSKTPEVLRLLDDPDDDVKAAAIRALKPCREEPSVCRRLLEILEREEPRVSLEAARVLLAQSNAAARERAVAHVRANLDAAPSERPALMRALAELPGDHATETLVSGLDDPDPDVRREAVSGLANRSTGREPAAKMIELLGDPDTADLARRALARDRYAGHLESRIDDLRTLPGIKLRAVDCLADADTERTRAILRQLLHHRDPSVAMRACRAMKPTEPSKVSTAHLDTATHHAVWLVLRTARLRRALEAMATRDRHVAYVKRALRGAQRARRELLVVLLEARGLEDMRDIVAALSSDDPDRKDHAVELMIPVLSSDERSAVLQGLGIEPSVPLVPEWTTDESRLAACLEDPDPWVRATAASCVVDRGLECDERLEALMRALDSGTDVERECARRPLPVSIDELSIETPPVSHLVIHLAGVRLFSSLEPGALAFIASEGEVREYQPGDILMAQNERSDCVHVLLKGSVRVETDGRAIAFRNAGEILGEMGVLLGRRRSATLVANATLLTLRIEADRFRQLYASIPAMAEAIIRSLAFRLRDVGTRHAQAIGSEVETQGDPG